MEVIITILLVFLIISGIGFIICQYLIYRNRKVLEFQFMVLNICAEYLYRHADSNINDVNWFVDKHTDKKLLFSIKPLKLKYWYTKEELEKIFN